MSKTLSQIYMLLKGTHLIQDNSWQYNLKKMWYETNTYDKKANIAILLQKIDFR
jgi:hypothetical protein